MKVQYTEQDINNFEQVARFLVRLHSCLVVSKAMASSIEEDMKIFEAEFLYKRLLHTAFGHIRYAFGDTHATTAILATSLDDDFSIGQRFTLLLSLPLFDNSFRPKFTSHQISRLLTLGTFNSHRSM